MKERNSEILLRFLRSLYEKDPSQTQLYLLGDVFDYWIGSGNYFVKKFNPIVKAIKELKQSGCRVVYVEGNHDIHIDKFWRNELNVEVFVDVQYNQIGNCVIRYEHGDLINKKDKAYLRYRSFYRSKPTQSLVHTVPSAVWNFIGKQASKKSRTYSSRMRKNQEELLVEMIREHAVRAYHEKPFDLVITGHMHVFDDYSFNLGERSVRSINLGSWLDGEPKALRVQVGSRAGGASTKSAVNPTSEGSSASEDAPIKYQAELVKL